MNVKLVTEFTGEVTVENNGEACLVKLQGSSSAMVQGLIAALFERKGHLDGNQVYSKLHFDGTRPIGWIGTVDVPEPLSVLRATEHRLLLLSKAA